MLPVLTIKAPDAVANCGNMLVYSFRGEEVA
jgi:hypothetical protein